MRLLKPFNFAAIETAHVLLVLFIAIFGFNKIVSSMRHCTDSFTLIFTIVFYKAPGDDQLLIFI